MLCLHSSNSSTILTQILDEVQRRVLRNPELQEKTLPGSAPPFVVALCVVRRKAEVLPVNVVFCVAPIFPVALCSTRLWIAEALGSPVKVGRQLHAPHPANSRHQNTWLFSIPSSRVCHAMYCSTCCRRAPCWSSILFASQENP